MKHPDPACPVVMFSESHPLAAPREMLTRRAVGWAADALADDDTTVNALARRLGVDWHTLWDALKVEAKRRADHPSRLGGVSALGLDEHVWRPGRFGAGREACTELRCRVAASASVSPVRQVRQQARSSVRRHALPVRHDWDLGLSRCGLHPRSALLFGDHGRSARPECQAGRPLWRI